MLRRSLSARARLHRAHLSRPRIHDVGGERAAAELDGRRHLARLGPRIYQKCHDRRRPGRCDSSPETSPLIAYLGDIDGRQSRRRHRTAHSRRGGCDNHRARRRPWLRRSPRLYDQALLRERRAAYEQDRSKDSEGRSTPHDLETIAQSAQNSSGRRAYFRQSSRKATTSNATSVSRTPGRSFRDGTDGASAGVSRARSLALAAAGSRFNA